VDKNLLLEVLRNHTANSDQEAAQIVALKKQYPFSQVLHAISAKLSKDFHFDSEQVELQQAAVYSTDRTVLKQIMTQAGEQAPVMNIVKVDEETASIQSEPRAESVNGTAVTKEAIQEIKPSPVVSKEKKPDAARENLVIYANIEKTVEGLDAADSLMKDLSRLSQLKHNFEMLFIDQPVSEVSTQQPVKETQHEEDPSTEEKESPKSRRAKIIELAKSMTQTSSDSTVQPPIKKRRKDQDELLEELQTTKEAIEPENERLKQQIQIIDQFIKTQPTIVGAKERNPVPPTDLNSVKSGEFGENIVSETLVEILIKQGKKDRAIEVLKKLIWKYPQKKAYFASQIEDLKK
jgi:hypothetical protein